MFISKFCSILMEINSNQFKSTYGRFVLRETKNIVSRIYGTSCTETETFVPPFETSTFRFCVSVVPVPIITKWNHTLVTVKNSLTPSIGQFAHNTVTCWTVHLTCSNRTLTFSLLLKICSTPRLSVDILFLVQYLQIRT